MSTSPPFPPAGVTLTAYDGPMIITQARTVIVPKIIRGTLVIAAENNIKRSKLVGNIDSDSPGVYEAHGRARPLATITSRCPACYSSRVSVLCGSNCLIEDSRLHGEYLDSRSDVVVRHNTPACEPSGNSNFGGYTGPGASFGSFAPLLDVTYDGNLLVADLGGFCLHAGHNPGQPYGRYATGILIQNNVSSGANSKCAVCGALTSFARRVRGTSSQTATGTTVRPSFPDPPSPADNCLQTVRRWI